LPFDPLRFLEFAREIHANKGYRKDSAWRTIAGRAYYASFLSSRKKLQELGYSFSATPDVHRQVIDGVRARNSGTANKLFTLRDSRNDADYNLMFTITSDQCTKLLKLAELVFQEVALFK